MLSQLDGYLAGVMVCPDLIMPSEWLPLVWGKDDDGNIAEPIFEDETQLRTTVDLVMRLYNTIGRDLTRGGDRYAPIYDAHPETGEVIWSSGSSDSSRRCPYGRIAGWTLPRATTMTRQRHCPS
ncbi:MULTISPECIES: UPF0149 family protein [unclassified Roseitalea]|nr:MULTISPECIES: UPF0149 family protein [unclassified Roseitalea]